MVETNPYETPFQVESTTGLRLNRERQDASPTARRDSTRVIPAVVCLILGYSLVGMSLAFRRWLRGWWRSAILTSLLGCFLGYGAFRIAIHLLS